MTAANFEVCLLASRVREVKHELRLRLDPLRGLHHELLECVEANYSDEHDSLLLRLRFSLAVGDATMQRRLLGHLRELGLDVIVPKNLSDSRRAEFESLAQRQTGVRLQLYPSAAIPIVVPQIFDTLEAHLATTGPARRLTTEIDQEPTRVAFSRSTTARLDDEAMGRSATVDALDHIIAAIPIIEADAEEADAAIDSFVQDDLARAATCEALESAIATLPLRLETFGPLDDMIASLSERAKTQDSLDAILDDLWS